MTLCPALFAGVFHMSGIPHRVHSPRDDKDDVSFMWHQQGSWRAAGVKLPSGCLKITCFLRNCGFSLNEQIAALLHGLDSEFASLGGLWLGACPVPTTTHLKIYLMSAHSKLKKKRINGNECSLHPISHCVLQENLDSIGTNALGWANVGEAAEKSRLSNWKWRQLLPAAAEPSYLTISLGGGVEQLRYANTSSFKLISHLHWCSTFSGERPLCDCTMRSSTLTGV